MKLLTLASSLSLATAYIQGYNIGGTNPDNTCKQTADYVKDFEAIPEGPNRVLKTFSGVSDRPECRPVYSVLEAAKQTNGRVVAGFWPINDATLNAEADALLEAIRAHGSEHLFGVVVLSEVLYREDITGAEAQRMVESAKSRIGDAVGDAPIGIADTWNAVIRPENRGAIEACDAIYVNSFPFWQGYEINNGSFALDYTISEVERVFPDKRIIIGETGWPTRGETFQNALPGKDNAEEFYREAFCPLSSRHDAFWFSLTDEPNKYDYTGQNSPILERSWGILFEDHTPKYSRECPSS